MAVEVGSKVPGKVTGITNFGAFVDLGEGKTGLVHISEVSDSYIKDIHDVLTVGDEVTVKVMSDQNGKIGLSIRKAVDHPKVQEHTRPQSSRPNNNRGGYRKPEHTSAPKKEGFDDLLSGFLKDSEDRLSTIKRNTEGKRGGRGGRRS